MTRAAKAPEPKDYFLIVTWRGDGIATGAGYDDGTGRISGVYVDSQGRRREFYRARLGSSVFETFTAANDAVKRKTAGAAKRMRKELARIERIASEGLTP